jgi:hypothetical protein
MMQHFCVFLRYTCEPKNKEEFYMQAEQSPFHIYTNEIQISLSYFDFTLVLKRMSEVNPATLATVSLSPQHAKALAQVLTSHVTEYEKIFGIIQTPDPLKMEQATGHKAELVRENGE